MTLLNQEIKDHQGNDKAVNLNEITHARGNQNHFIKHKNHNQQFTIAKIFLSQNRELLRPRLFAHLEDLQHSNGLDPIHLTADENLIELMNSCLIDLFQ